MVGGWWGCVRGFWELAGGGMLSRPARRGRRKAPGDGPRKHATPHTPPYCQKPFMHPLVVGGWLVQRLEEAPRPMAARAFDFPPTTDHRPPSTFSGPHAGECAMAIRSHGKMPQFTSAFGQCREHGVSVGNGFVARQSNAPMNSFCWLDDHKAMLTSFSLAVLESRVFLA